MSLIKIFHTGFLFKDCKNFDLLIHNYVNMIWISFDKFVALYKTNHIVPVNDMHIFGKYKQIHVFSRKISEFGRIISQVLKFPTDRERA